MRIDADLIGVWIFHPTGRALVCSVCVERGYVLPSCEHCGGSGSLTARQGGIQIIEGHNGYGDPPYRFRAYKQNGSRLWLRLLDADGKDARYPDTDEFLPGHRIERRAYTSDVRRGIYWSRA